MPLDFALLLPELILSGLALALLLVIAFWGDRSLRVVAGLVAAGFVAVLVVLAYQSGQTAQIFNSLMVVDNFSTFTKGLILVAGLISLALAFPYIERTGIARPELPLLMLFATIGMMGMVGSNDLITLYVAIELQSLPLYVLAAIRRDEVRSSEAGLKYFVLGALSSGLLLYGVSLIYGFAGTTGFDGIAAAITHGQTALQDGTTGAAGRMLCLAVGLAFVVAGLAFKIGAVPFHMWTPDVYEGSPSAITAFFALATKIAAFALLIRVLLGPFGQSVEDWRPIIAAAAALSMVLGGLSGLVQRNVKRLIAYSSIANVGYALAGLTAGTPEAGRAVLVFLSIYVLMTTGLFALLMSMKRQGRMVETLDDLAGLSRTRPGLALMTTLVLCSLVGLPPLAGFLAKYEVFRAAVQGGLVWLAVLGMLSSVIAAYYYLRLVKIMWFDPPVEPALDKDEGFAVRSLAYVAGLGMLILFVLPDPLMRAAAWAVEALPRVAP